jgi:diguanylate cyclase (GGDEF)-like protein
MRLTTAGPPAGHRLSVDRLPRAFSAGLLVVVLVLTFLLDRGTDAAPVQHLYYLPIIFAALRFGTRGGLILAGAAIVLYHVANPHLLSFRYEEADLVQVILFASVGLVSAKLTDDARRLHGLAMTDDLTGLHNLRSFESHLTAMVRAERETGSPLSVLVLDVDRLKSLNDAHGHLAGASAVRMVGHTLASRLPDSAVACRYGGDEFVIALPGCPRSEAVCVARGLCAAVHELAPRLAGIQFEPGRLTISIGVAGGMRSSEAASTASDDDKRAEALFRAADEALYEAKRNGRNSVVEARD